MSCSHLACTVVFGAAAVLGSIACSTTTQVTTPSPTASATAEPEPAPVPEASPLPTADACGPLPPSQCTPKNQGSIVRGVVKFDRSKLAPDAKAYLRVYLHHEMVLRADEARQGGHPHAYDSFPIDPTKDEVAFAIDLCSFGTAMWSEENCGFHLVTIIDDDGKNDPEAQGSLAMMPRTGKLVKLTPLEISCHKPATCLQIVADCTDGEACTTYTPPTKCACAPNSCPSDDAYCKTK
jgi:hypothetical protein